MVEANLDQPLHAISFGAGVQSSALALMASEGLVGPMPAAAIFADTECESAETYTWLAEIGPMLKFPIVRVGRGNLSEALVCGRAADGHLYLERTLPAFKKRPDGSVTIQPRNCTRWAKVEPVSSAFLGMMRARKLRRGVMWLGISVDEAHRMKPSRYDSILLRWPLVEAGLSRRDCEHYLTRFRLAPVPKSSCVFCPFRDFRTNTPEEMQFAVAVEKRYQAEVARYGAAGGVPYLHPSCRPLGEIDLDGAVQSLDLWGNECEGHCGI